MWTMLTRRTSISRALTGNSTQDEITNSYGFNGIWDIGLKDFIVEDLVQLLNCEAAKVLGCQVHLRVNKKQVFFVALVGAPASGKTSISKMIFDWATRIGYKVIILYDLSYLFFDLERWYSSKPVQPSRGTKFSSAVSCMITSY